MNNTAKFILSIAIPLAIGATAGYFTVTGLGNWYETINKPAWNPPNAVFGPVWTSLYVLMGIAFYLVWKQGSSPQKSKAIVLYCIQLAFNFSWSFLFFNRHLIGGALIEMILLWIFILLTIVAFGKISKAAAWLMVPYICWVSFAMVLNYTIWQLNQ